MVRSLGGALKITTSGKKAPTISIVKTDFTSNMGMLGGAIYMDQINSLTVVIDDCTFTNNRAISGGVIYIEEVEELDFQVKGSTFEDNSATTNGGTLKGLLSADSKIAFTTSTMSNSRAAQGSFFNIEL